MIALALPRSLTKSLVLDSEDGGKGFTPESSAELHLTLAYLGKADDRKADKDTIERVVKDFASTAGSLEGRVSGQGRFNNDTGEGKHAFYASFDSPGLASFRQELIDRLSQAGIEADKKHGFTPHITLAYMDSDASTPNILPTSDNVTITRLLLAWGGKKQYFDLG